jgi:hypothetical protein
MPELQSSDILDLRNALTAIRDGDMPGRGPFPVIYTINDNVELWANMTWMQEWSPRYPQFATGGASTEH